LIDCIIDLANRLCIVSEAKSFNNDITTLTVRRTTSWESSSNREESESEVVVIVITSIESNL